MSLPEFLISHNIVGISGVDTRSLVTHIRNHGSQKACIISDDTSIADAKIAMQQFPDLINTDPS